MSETSSPAPRGRPASSAKWFKLPGWCKPWEPWLRRRRLLKQAAFAVELAELRAARSMAAYKKKADIEWDLQWLQPDAKSYRDEVITIIWGFPLVALWVPGLRDFATEGFKAMAAIHSTLPQVYTYGWIAILTFVFGGKQVAAPFLATRHARLIEALGAVKDDIPRNVVNQAQDYISPPPYDAYDTYPNQRPPA